MRASLLKQLGFIGMLGSRVGSIIKPSSLNNYDADKP